MKKCFQQPANAYEEARRRDYQRAEGVNYSLREFHDAFVKQGGIPMIRRLMVPGDTSGVS